MSKLVKTIGIDELRGILDTIQRRQYVKTGFARTGARMQRELSKYPEREARSAPFVSDKQRRYFFAALRDGRITVPYRRTGLLGRRWLFKVEGDPGGATLEVGNDTPYGIYVQSAEHQAAIHRGIWHNTDQAVFDRNVPLIVDDIIAAFDAETR